MKKRYTVILVVLLTGLILGACGKIPNLNNTKWQLTEINGQPALEDSKVTLNLNDGKLGGTDGCNTYGGSYTVKGVEFKAGDDIFSTMMYCSDTINTQSTAFYTALSQAVSFKIQEQTLALIGENGTTLLEFSMAKE